MFSRAWSTILAAGGVVVILSVAADARPVWKHLGPPPIQKRALDAAPRPSPTPEPQSQAVPAPEQPKSEPAPPPVISPAPVISIAIEDKGSRDEASRQRDQSAEQREERALDAQRSMADASWWTAGTRWAKVFIGLIALIALGGTVYYTRKTSKAAITATDAAVASAKTADDTFKISKLSMEASDRAYVHHNGVRYVSHAELSTGRVLWRLRPMWINTGNTPTRRMKIFVAYELLDALLSEDYTFPTPDLNSLPNTSIPPKGTIASGSRDFLGDDLVAVRNGTKHLYVWGVTVYRDVFPGTPQRITKFCVRATGIIGNPLIESSEDTNKMEIIFVFHSPHNCADEDCA